MNMIPLFLCIHSKKIVLESLAYNNRHDCIIKPRVMTPAIQEKVIVSIVKVIS